MFKPNEIALAKTLVEAGLKRAAQSFGTFTNEHINLTSTRFNMDDEIDLLVKTMLKHENVYFISSEIRGDIKGVSFLVFTQRDADEFFAICFPNKDPKLPENFEMRDAILLELANILTASVVSEFADKLGIKLYGYVPVMQFFHQGKIDQTLEQTLLPFKSTICFDTVFAFDHDRYKPMFLWALEEKFIHQIKASASHMETPL